MHRCLGSYFEAVGPISEVSMTPFLNGGDTRQENEFNFYIEMTYCKANLDQDYSNIFATFCHWIFLFSRCKASDANIGITTSRRVKSSNDMNI